MTGVTKSWRTRNRDTKMLNMYLSLVPKMIEAEKVLRGIIGTFIALKLDCMTVCSRMLGYYI